MAEENTAGISSNDLAFERTLLAHERTLMAWIRTSTSMISFGFTIYKFFEEMTKKPGGVEGLITPRVVGLVMICFGLLGLLLAQIQHQQALRRLKEFYPHAQRSLSALLAILTLVFGLLLFLGALFRQ
ncbi:DUF202 domain-containing protein [Flavihumibacter sp. R14]|nr:DUF202 domain-containing protein [Flavihumibacter soli]